jgi:hypothetical protein
VWWIRDVYPGSRILIFTHPGSRISDPKTATKDRGGKKNFQTIFCSHKFHKTEYYFIFDMLNKKIWHNFQRIIEVFTQKIVTKPSKILVWDPRSEIQKKPIPDPRSRIQGSKRHRIPDPDPQHWARCHFTGPKKLENSRAQPLPTSPRNGYARIQNIMHGAVCKS